MVSFAAQKKGRAHDSMRLPTLTRFKAKRRTWPTRRSPVLVNATTLGVVRPPSLLGTMVGLPPSIAATAELVVPKSMPTTCVRGGGGEEG